MEVYWLEQTEADVPARDDWLTASETAQLSTFRFPKRRSDWRLGRWTAKVALARYFKLPAHPRILANIEIRAASSGAPDVFFQNKPAEASISLSHRSGIAACAIASSTAALGCDLEIIEPRSDAFLADYFTTEEQSFVADAAAEDRSRLLALLWSAKESALKALHTGLRLDTRSVIVGPFEALQREIQEEKGCVRNDARLDPSLESSDNWFPLQVCTSQGKTFNGWWQHTRNFIRTVVATPSPQPPILLA